MRRINLSLFAFSLLFLASTSSAEHWIAKTIPPYLDGWQEEGGTCLANCDYSLGVLIKGSQRLFYLGKKSAQSTDSDPRWQVLDTMPYPELPTGYELIYSACEHQGTPDSSLIAVVKTADAEWLDQVRFAYKANIAKGSFETMSTAEVRCQNIASGL